LIESKQGHPVPRILVLFGSIPLYGQERGNIEALRAVKEHLGAEVLFVTHEEWGHQVIQPELDRQGLPWTSARYAGRFEKGMSLRHWMINLRDMLVASWQLEKIASAFHPTHIHVGNPAYFLNFLPWLLLRKIPVVYRVGDEPALHHVLYRLLWKKSIFKRTSIFVANSEFIKHSLLKAGCGISKIVQIYNKPPNKRNFPNINDSDAIYSFDGYTFLYIGQISYHKGVSFLIEAARQIIAGRRDVRFLVVGDYTWMNPFADVLIAEIARDALDDRIIFTGYSEDVDALWANADLHICPSVWQEPSANVVFEAKQAAIPSIIFPSGGLPELIRHGIDGYICRDMTIAALVEALHYYLAEPQRMVKQGRAAHDSLEETLKTASFAERWSQVYLQTME